ncbi:ring-hydroxylating oxygenase subunit alpha [soil metagenome]
MASVFDPKLPLTHAHTIPAAWYHDPAVADAETKVAFGATWQFVGRTEQVAKPGEYLTANIAGEPVLIVCGEDAQLRAFFNVCRHRAAPLLNEPCGQVAKLRCRYHGWTYDLAGQLRGTPEFEGVCDFTKDENGLVPVAVETWGPFVFVNLSPPVQTLEQYLSPMPEWACKHDPFNNLTWHARHSYDLHCNWKVYVDNYLDGGYHVNTVHPALAGVLNYHEYTTTTHGFTALQSSPLKPSDSDAGRTRIGTHAAYWWAFPNFMVNLTAGVMDTNLVLQLGPDRCRVIFDFWFATELYDAFKAESIRVAEQVQAEDIAICEEVQRGLRSRSYDTGRFSVKRENAGYHFQQLLATCLNEQRTE